MSSLKNIMLDTILITIKMIRVLIPKGNKVAFIAPAPHGSLGDQALINGLYIGMQKYNVEMVEILLLDNNAKQVIADYEQDTFGPYLRCRANIVKICWKILRYRALIIVGADTIDGTYYLLKNLFWFDIADSIVKLGIPTSFVSFSFSSSPNLNAVERLKKMSSEVSFYSRDPNSRARFEEFTGLKAGLSADLAFLMNPSTDNDNVKAFDDWIMSKKSEGKIVIGLNINFIDQQLTYDCLVEAYTNAILSLQKVNKNIAFALVPHDFREGQSDFKVLNDVLDKAKATIGPNIELVNGEFNCWDAKYMCRNLDFVITGRMHFAIAALSQGVPAYGISYKDKFQGLMQHLNVEGNLLDRDLVLESNKLQEFFKVALETYVANRSTIAENLPSARAKSLINLSCLD